MHGSPRVWFATSNDHKFRECSFVLAQLGIAPGRLISKGAELQSADPAEVASHAAAGAYAAFGKPLFVEDSALSIDRLSGFPGTYASYVFGTLGADGVLKLMEGARGRRAEFVAAVAYCDGPDPPRVFTGRLEGRISQRPAGGGGFGFDPIFVPRGSALTLAQMTLERKCAVSHRARALREFGAWLNRRRSG
jgi:XTP/dITP diphosphohydrolase